MADDPPGPKVFPVWQRALVFGLGYFFCAMAGRYLSPPGGTYVSFWLPAGLYMAVLLVNERRHWLLFALAALPANVAFDLLHDTPVWLILCFYAGNTVQSLMGAWLVERFVAVRPSVATLREFVGLLTFGGVLNTAVGAAIGAGALVLAGLSSSFWQSWKVWWGSCAMAVLLVTPLILVWSATPVQVSRGRTTPARALEVVGLFAGLLLSTWYLLVEDRGILAPYLFRLMPFLVWAGLRFGLRGVTAANLVLALCVAFLTTQVMKGIPPAQIVSGRYVFTMQTFLLVASLVGIIPAIVLAERDRTLAKLRESEARFRAVVESSPAAVAVAVDDKVVYLNPAGERQFRLAGNFTGRSIYDFVPLEFQEQIRARRKAVVEQGLPAPLIEGTILRADGSAFIMESQGVPFVYDGRPAILNHIHDITARKQNEAALVESRAKLVLAAEIARIAYWEYDVAAERFEFDENFFQLYRTSSTKEGGPHLSVAEYTRRFLPAEEGDMFARDIAAALSSTDLSYSRQLEHRVIWGDFTSGYVAVRFSVGRDATGKPAKIYGVNQDITERRLGEDALRTSEERLRLALDATSMGTWDMDVRTRLVERSPDIARLFGVPPHQLGNSHDAFMAVVKAEDREALRLQMQETMAGRKRDYRAEFRVVWPDGSEHWIEGRGRLHDDPSGRPARITGTVVDITQRKRAELELRASEERFRSYFELPIVGLCITSLEKGFIAVNDQLCSMVGYSRDELMRKRWPDLTHGEDLVMDVARFTRVLAGEAPGYSADKRLLRKNGEIIHVTVSIRCVRRLDGSPDYFIGLIQDITERKRAEDALRENQRALTTLISNLPGLTYRCRNDLNWTMEFVSEGGRDLTGYPPEDLIEGRRINYSDLIHPEDRPLVWQKVQAGLTARVPFELTYRLRTAGGVEKWVWERGQGIFAPDGTVIALEGFITDTTARRQAELEREQALAREQQAQEEFTRQLIASQEAERRRIAGELHDSLGQNLLLLKNRAQLALNCPGVAVDLRNQIEGMREAAAQAITEVRQISQDLHPYQIEHLGLKRALTAMIENVGRSTSIVFEQRLDAVDDVLQGDMAANLYRVVQEALNNILKHSGASRVRILLERDVRDVRLWIEDDGRGFSADGVEGSVRGDGFGLKNIAERVRILGGALSLNSQPGAGACLEVVIPLHNV